MIIPCWNASCYSLRIYYSGSEISTRLINNQTYDTKKEVNFEHGNSSRHWKLLPTKCRSRSSYKGRGWLTQCPNFRGLSTTKVTWHYTWSLYSLQCIRFIFPFNRKQLSAFQLSFERLKVLLAARTSLDLQGKGLTNDCLELEGLKWPEALKRFPPNWFRHDPSNALFEYWKNFPRRGMGLHVERKEKCCLEKCHASVMLRFCTIRRNLIRDDTL